MRVSGVLGFPAKGDSHLVLRLNSRRARGDRPEAAMDFWDREFRSMSLLGVLLLELYTRQQHGLMDTSWPQD